MKDEIIIPSVRALTIATLLEEYAHSFEGNGALPTSKRQAWLIAQDLKRKTEQEVSA
ncbi:hypothetical protein uvFWCGRAMDCOMC440_032 [Freshwater phage uvFW-CGR-AMD-COM-C440]|nr:hypothetical protein uvFWCGRAMDCOMC440_032 [Freshwater phage uvFW-CGR-AMD-COM-C440]